ncbi:hypothetical protein [Streptomyces sp. NPDC001985]|uniref:hypothetical protein n=1 Tax=Streptomyces sp. NPDC001985 TaxID=3154406 RepID=UPI00331B24F0
MARRHPTGWEVLGFAADPTPGDPEAIRVLSTTYRELGDRAGEAFDLLRDDSRIRAGKGRAMDALRDRIKEVPGMLERTRNSFQRAADAYNGYADTLTTAQDMLDRAIDQGREAEATARTELPRLAPDATPEQTAGRADEQRQVDEAKSRLSAAEALGRDAERLREDGSRTASVVLDEAADQAIEARGVFQQIGDFFADNPLIELVAGIIVGIIAVFLPVVGLLLGAALFAVSVIRMASQGKFDVGELLIGALTLVPGGVLLGGLGKIGASAAKLAKVAPVLATFGKGTGTISGALTKVLDGTTAFRKIFTPLTKGIAGVKISPGLALGGKVLVEAGTEFTLGFTASVITAAVERKPFDPRAAAIGAAIGAATGGALGAFGGTKFAAGIKNAFVVENKFKSNIGKAFSKESLGIVNGTFSFGNVLFVNGREMPQKSGFHGIKSSTGSSSATGEAKTKITTPDGTKTETTIDPGAQKPPKQPEADGADGGAAPPVVVPPPVISAKTTTPDGFTSVTTGGQNTIASPSGDKIVSDGTTTTVETPLGGKLPPLTTGLTPGGFTTSGPFGEISRGPDGTTISAPPPPPPPPPDPVPANDGDAPGAGDPNPAQVQDPAQVQGPVQGQDPVQVQDLADDPDLILPDPLPVPLPNDGANGGANDGAGAGAPDPVPNPPGFTLTDNAITIPGGPSVVTGDTFTTVQGDGISATHQAGATSFFGTADPAATDLPVLVHNPGNGDLNADLGNGNTLSATTGTFPAGVTLNGDAVALGAGGAVTVGNTGEGAGGQVVTLPPAGDAISPVTVKDGAVTTELAPDGGARITIPDGPVTTLDDGGFTVSTGTAQPTTVRFDGANAALDITPGGGPPVGVAHDGTVTAGPLTAGPGGIGTVTDPGGAVTFTPNGVTLPGTAAGTPVTVGVDGAFTAGGVVGTPDGTLTSGTTTVSPGPGGSAKVTAGGQEFTVGSGGVITTKGPDGAPVPHSAQPLPSAPVTLGDVSVGVDGTGTPVITAQGTGGTTVTVTGGTTTVGTAAHQVTTGSGGGITTTLTHSGATVTTNPAGTTTLTQGGTTVTTGPAVPTTVTSGTGPAVTVTPGGQGSPTQAVTSDGTASAFTGNGAQTSVGGTPAAVAAADGDGGITTTAPAGGHTTVTHSPAGTTARDNDGGFAVDSAKTLTDGDLTITPGTSGDAPSADITDNGPGGGQAQLTQDGITAQGLTVTVDPGGGVSVSGPPGDGGTAGTLTSAPDGTIGAQGPGGEATAAPPVTVPLLDGGTRTVPGPVTVTGPAGTVTQDGGTTTFTQAGFTTTFTQGDTGTTVETVHDASGVGHTIDPAGQTTVQNSPSGAAIEASSTGAQVVTPPAQGWPVLLSPAMTGGGNTLSNGPDGPVITTQGSHPVADPGTTVTHNTAPDAPPGEVTVVHGPATGTFTPGGITSLGPSGTHVDGTGAPIDTAGRPIGDGPGQTAISQITGDGGSGIAVPAFGGAGSIAHHGFFGGTTTVDTGSVTLTKSTDGSPENAGTAGQKSGVLDGPAHPVNPTTPGPPVFTAGASDGNGASVEVPLKGGGSTVHNGSSDVVSDGKGGHTVTVPGSTDPNDTVTISQDGALTGPGVVTPPPLPAGQEGPRQPPHATLSDGTTVVGGAPPTVTAPGAQGPVTTFTHGTATTADPANGITITQNADGSAAFQHTGAGGTTALDLTSIGAQGTVTGTGGDGGPATYGITLGDSGAVRVKDGGGKVTELDQAGSFHEQHSPSDRYDGFAGGPTALSDWRDYAYGAASGLLKNLFTAGFQSAYQISQGADVQNSLENAAIRAANGIGNGLATQKLNDQYAFKTEGLETGLAGIPTKTIANLNNDADIESVNPASDRALTTGG